MRQIKKLGELPLGQSAIVKIINGNSALMKRIISLGVSEGTEITPLFRAPLADPTAYSVKGSVIALRRSDCAGIAVVTEDEQEDDGDETI